MSISGLSHHPIKASTTWIRSHLQNRMVMNTYLIMAIRLLGTVSGFVFWILAARSLTAENVGLASAAVAAATLLARFAQLGIGQTLVRYLPGEATPIVLVNSAITIVMVVSGALAVIFLAGAAIWSPAQVVLLSSSLAVITFLILVTTSTLANLLTWIFLAYRKPVHSLVRFLLQAVLSVVLLIVTTRITTSYLAVMMAYTLSVAVSTAMAVFLLLPKVEPGYRLRIVRLKREYVSLSSYALSNFVADFLRTAPHNLVPVLAINILGPSTAAILFIVWSAAIGLDSMAESAAPSYFAEGANDPEGTVHYGWKAIRLGCGLAAIFTIGAIIGGQFFLYLFGSLYASQGYLTFVLLVASILPSVVVSIYLSMLRVRNRVRLLVVISMCDLVLGLAAVTLGMLRLGLPGVGTGWLISRILVLGIVLAAHYIRQLHEARSTATPHQSRIVAAKQS